MYIGNFLNQQEVNDMLSSFDNNKKFQNLIYEMQKFEDFSFNKQTVEVIHQMKFDAATEKNIISAKSLILKVSEDIEIRYVDRYIDGNKKTNERMFIGVIERANEEGNGFVQTLFFAQYDSLISSIQRVIDEKTIISKEEYQTIMKELPIDENYYPGKLNETVQLQTWKNGCLAGGYMWCGGGCGGYPACKNSTNDGKNATDACCKRHDCCYGAARVSYPDCACDIGLCYCVLGSPKTLWHDFIVQAMCFNC